MGCIVDRARRRLGWLRCGAGCFARGSTRRVKLYSGNISHVDHSSTQIAAGTGVQHDYELIVGEAGNLPFEHAAILQMYRVSEGGRRDHYNREQ